MKRNGLARYTKDIRSLNNDINIAISTNICKVGV